MKKKSIRFKYNHKTMAQTNHGKSETQPDMVYTIAEMIARTSQGMSIPTDNRLQYPEDEDDTLLQINDLSDIDPLKESVKQFEEKIEKQKENKKLKEAKTNDEVKSDVEDDGGTTEDEKRGET